MKFSLIIILLSLSASVLAQEQAGTNDADPKCNGAVVGTEGAKVPPQKPSPESTPSAEVIKK